MKKSELARTINRQAHMLAAQSFPAIHRKLETLARAMLKDGRSLEEALDAIRQEGVTRDGREP